MSLAAPTNLTLVNLIRVMGNHATAYNVYRQLVTAPGPADITLMGVLRWNNTETGPHTVEVVVNGKTAYVGRGATSLLVELGRRFAPDLSNLEVNASVKLISTSASSSPATLTTTLDIKTAPNEFTSPSMAIEGNQIRLPVWSGWINISPSMPRQIGFVQYWQDSMSVALRPIVPLANSTFSSAAGFQPYAASEIQSYDSLLDLPTTLQQSAIHRATFNVRGGQLSTSKVTYIVREQISRLEQLPNSSFRNRIFPALYRDLLYYDLPEVSRVATLFFEAPVPVGPFIAEDVEAKMVKNTVGRFDLKATYRATWSLTAQSPGNFVIEYDPPAFGSAGPDRAYLVGAFPTAGSFVMPLTATKVGSTTVASAKATITVVDSLPRTTIAANSTIAREGIDSRVGQSVNLSLASTPSVATWRAEGLPPGVTIDSTGMIGGIPSRAGVFFASITAQAVDFDVSLPLTIRFVVGVGTTPLGSEASQRIPWLLTEWRLTDLQVVARSRDVQSTFLEGEGGLRIKLGDDVSFAVFFVGVNNEVFAMAPETLRLTVRPANNLDDVLVFKSATPPVEVVREGMTYYEMNVRTGNRERDLALEWVVEAEDNEALPCVADLDWTKDGKIYSSRTFPMLLELDVTRP